MIKNVSLLLLCIFLFSTCKKNENVLFEMNYDLEFTIQPGLSPFGGLYGFKIKRIATRNPTRATNGRIIWLLLVGKSKMPGATANSIAVPSNTITASIQNKATLLLNTSCSWNWFSVPRFREWNYPVFRPTRQYRGAQGPNEADKNHALFLRQSGELYNYNGRTLTLPNCRVFGDEMNSISIISWKKKKKSCAINQHEYNHKGANPM